MFNLAKKMYSLFRGTTFYCFLLFIALLALPVRAEPWVDSENVFLRANIQLLADAGIIKSPVTTYPLMWVDIADDITAFPSYDLSENHLDALLYVKHQLKLAKENLRTIKLTTAIKDKRFTSFGDSFREKNSLKFSKTFLTDRFAFKVATNYTHAPSDGDKLHFNGSYGAFFIGNWVFSAGMQDKWWGPGLDTSLSLSNNARAIPALTLTRKSAEPFDIPFTDISVPWTVTTFMGRMDDERVIKDTLLWGFRFNFKATDNLELGLTRLAQWAGEGRPRSLSTFIDVLKGLDNCGGNGPSVDECAAGQEPGNQLAGYDIRWSDTLFGQPFAIGFTSFAEDGDRKGGLSILGEERYQVNIETNLNAFDYYWKVYIEGTDTYAICSDGNNGPNTSSIGDCYYEHHIYQTGMRYRGKTVGSLYDNDATSLVLGATTLSNASTQFDLKLRWLQLNKDNHDKAPGNPIIGNPLTSIAENITMLSGKVQHSYKNWRFTLGSDVSQSNYDNNIDDDTNINVYLDIEVNL